MENVVVASVKGFRVFRTESYKGREEASGLSAPHEAVPHSADGFDMAFPGLS